MLGTVGFVSRLLAAWCVGTFREKLMSNQQDSVPWWRNDPWLGRQLWHDRRARFPVEQLVPYAGQTIAWFPDGSGIRDAGPDRDTLWSRFTALGEDPAWYIYEDLAPPGQEAQI
jgi:hypothetical protein